jgi:hypothetical protein
MILSDALILQRDWMKKHTIPHIFNSTILRLDSAFPPRHTISFETLPRIGISGGGHAEWAVFSRDCHCLESLRNIRIPYCNLFLHY